MKNIILQHYDGELGEIEKESIKNIKGYAKFVGAEYELVTGRAFRENLSHWACQKMCMLDERWDEYDDLLMLDIDMFVPKSMKENVFDVKGIGLYTDTQKMLHRKIVNMYPIIASASAPYWGGAIYKLSRAMRKKLRKQLGGDESWMLNFNKRWNFGDEGIMHVLAYRAGITMKTPDIFTDKKWCQDSFLPNPEKAGFIHIRKKIKPGGPEQEKIDNLRSLQKAGIVERQYHEPLG